MLNAALLVLAFFSEEARSMLETLKANPDQIKEIVAENGGTPMVFGNTAMFLAYAPSNVPRLVSDHNEGPQRFDPKTSGETMQPIGSSGWYYLITDLAPGSRVEYRLVINGEATTDPNNPRHHETWGSMVSELRLDNYPAYPEFQEPVKKRGKIIETDLQSNILNNTRKVYIYLPPDYDKNYKRYPTVYFNDGGFYVKDGRIPDVLDWLISKRKIKGVIGVFIDPVDRSKEYRMNADFRKMMAREIIPFIDRNYRTLARRQERLMVGGSRGGLCAADLVLHHPELFAMCAPLAPALNPTSLLTDLPKAGENKVSFFILACRYDARFYDDAPALQKRLRQQGYSASIHTIPEGHNIRAWSRSMDDVLIHFLSPRATKSKAFSKMK